MCNKVRPKSKLNFDLNLNKNFFFILKRIELLIDKNFLFVITQITFLNFVVQMNFNVILQKLRLILTYVCLNMLKFHFLPKINKA